MDYDKTDLANHYDRARSLSAGAIRSWIDSIAAHVPSTQVSKIIDIGCGTGRFSFALADRYSAHVLGIDPSEKMLAEARRKAVAKNVAFRLGSGEQLPANDESIDLLFMSQTFHHLRDRSRAALEVFRVARPGGFVVVRNGTRDQLRSFAHSRFFPGFDALVEAHLPSVAEIRATFLDKGFKIIAHDVVPQATASSWSEFADKTALRADSLIVRLSDAEFEAGMRILRAHASKADAAHPVTEKIDLLILRKPDS
jgi:ubiquinone/menaquinone biosynthesis C-methylase UbiE